MANLFTNLAFRTLNGSDTTLTDLATAVAAFVLDSDTDSVIQTVGEATGALIRTILAVEIPTTTSTDVSYY
jgi:Ca2+/H+ antiporter